jgi:hypothetical protein
MARGLSMATRREVVQKLRERYQRGSAGEKTTILDELVALTGYHRKHAIRVLGADIVPASITVQRRSWRRYGLAIKAALIVLWEASDRICGKRLRPLIPVLLPALERHALLKLNDADRRLVLSVSAPTIDRLLADVRVVASGGLRRRAGFSSAVRRRVPVRTFGDWNDPPPGFLEVDLVAHGGTSVKGSFIQTLVATDIATGWTECVPLLIRDGTFVVEALLQVRSLLPFPLRGVDFDNDSVFMNDTVVDWCLATGLTVTRSRAYRKNDQAWVEQKNGAIVRRLVGYGRFEGHTAAQSLGRLYAAARLHGNAFLPSFKLQHKHRIGARVIKRYHAPKTPLERTLAHPHVAAHDKGRLRALYPTLDPVILLSQIRAAQGELGNRIAHRGAVAPPDSPSTASNLQTAWQDGEIRPTHRRRYVRTKPVPRRAKTFDDVRSEIDKLLRANPTLSAVELMSVIRGKHPGCYDDVNLRTMQRERRRWSENAMKRLIGEGAIAVQGAFDSDTYDETHSTETQTASSDGE